MWTGRARSFSESQIFLSEKKTHYWGICVICDQYLCQVLHRYTVFFTQNSKHLTASFRNCFYSMVWCPNLHSYGTEWPHNFFWRAHRWEPIHHTSLQTWYSSDGKSWCAWWTSGEGKGGNYPQVLPESSEAAGGRLLHLTASRSNNCKSHFRESLPRNWSMSTGSFKAAAHFAGSSTLSWRLSCISLLHYVINFICVAVSRSSYSVLYRQ